MEPRNEEQNRLLDRTDILINEYIKLHEPHKSEENQIHGFRHWAVQKWTDSQGMFLRTTRGLNHLREIVMGPVYTKR